MSFNNSSLPKWRIDFVLGATFQQIVVLRDRTQTPLDLTGVAARLTLCVGTESVLDFSTDHAGEPTPRLGQIENVPEEGKLIFTAHHSVAAALVDGATGVLFVTWADGRIQALAAITIRI